MVLKINEYNMIFYFFILIYALVIRWLLYKIYQPLWLNEIIRYTGGVVPLGLLISEVFPTDWLTIVLSGICFFWFPMVVSKKV